jgi:hypothetical protein
MSNKIKLETSNLILEFSRDNGSLIRIYSKISGWDIIKREHLGLSWKLMLPLEGRRNNNAWGHLQPAAPACTEGSGKVSFVWSKISTEFGGEQQVEVASTCEIVNDQAVFRMKIKNRSQQYVENVYYPYIGDLYRTEGCKRLVFEHGEYIGLKSLEMYPTFPNPVGTHSVDYPTMVIQTDHANPPMYPFGLISDQVGNGLYLGLCERRISPVTWHAEALPGWRKSMDFRLFDGDKTGDKEVYTRFAVGHMPFVAPDMDYELLPFAMDAFKGDWAAGINCYTKSSKNWNKLPKKMPAWAKEPHSWLQIHINSPEDELRIKFKDLPKIGAECKQYGVDAIQLVGWNDGGQDRGNPSHDPDPRLGTFEELKQAIAEIKAMGIKLILFAKFVWADQSNTNFESIYKDLSIKDPYGNYYVYKGYQYMTLSQMANVNTRRLIPMCFGSEKYLEICNTEFQKCVDLGADGILFDECLHHSPTLCCFDTSHGHRYGESTYQFDEKLIEGFRKIVADREFLIAGEAIYDFQHNYYDVSYARTWGRDHKPTNRYMRPRGEIMTAVIGFDDRDMVNQCLLNRYIISYEPYNFKGMLSDYPTTVFYGKKMDKLRTDLRKWFWDGDFCNKQGATVTTGDNTALSSFSVFTAKDSSQGMVVCNYDGEKTIQVLPALTSGAKLTNYRLIDWTDSKSFDGWIELPPMSAAAIY